MDKIFIFKYVKNNSFNVTCTFVLFSFFFPISFQVILYLFSYTFFINWMLIFLYYNKKQYYFLEIKSSYKPQNRRKNNFVQLNLIESLCERINNNILNWIFNRDITFQSTLVHKTYMNTKNIIHVLPSFSKNTFYPRSVQEAWFHDKNGTSNGVHLTRWFLHTWVLIRPHHSYSTTGML